MDAVVVRPGDDQLRGDDRADAWLVEELGHERADVVEDLALERRRPRRSRPRSAARASAARGRRELVGCARARSGGSGCSGGAARRPAAAAARARSSSGAVTITLRSWTSATRRTSTALRRASKQHAQSLLTLPRPRQRERSVASAERAARIASSGSSLPRSRRSARLVRPTSCTARRCRGEMRAQARRRSDRRPRPPRRDRRARTAPRSAAPRVAACARRHRPLRDHRARRRGDDRERVLIAMGVDTDHVVQPSLQASRPILRLVGSGTPVWSRETARQVCDESRRRRRTSS